MFLPGENAKRHRSALANILLRYFAGDPSLIREVEANAASDAPVAQMARAALAAEGGSASAELALEERRLGLRERELALLERQAQLKFLELKMQAEIQERQNQIQMAKETHALELKKSEEKHNLEMKTAEEKHASDLKTAEEKHASDMRERTLHRVETGKQVLESVMPDWKADKRLKLQIEDWAKNSIFAPPGGAAADAGPGRLASITLSQVAQEMGHRPTGGQLSAIGKLVKMAYTNEHGGPPPMHEQFVGGAVRKVCSYTEDFRGVMEDKIRLVMGA